MEQAMSDSPSLLVFGAHPDDCEFTAGGLAALYAARGGRVCFVSVTNGDAGHQTLGGTTLARIRREEARCAAAVIGIDSRVLDNHDGELTPTLERRREIIGIIRDFRPDLILTPRPNDYHADHLPRDPVIMYVRDHFKKPYPFTPDVVVDIESVVDKKAEMMHCHASQVYEWLPYNGGYLDQVPADPEARRSWLRERREAQMRAETERYRDLLVAKYGPERGARIQYAEAFEACEYGSPLTAEARERLFPM